MITREALKSEIDCIQDEQAPEQSLLRKFPKCSIQQIPPRLSGISPQTARLAQRGMQTMT